MSSAQEKRLTVRHMAAAGMSLTRACRALKTSRSSLGYLPRRKADEVLSAAIEEVRKKKPRWGQVRIHHRLRREGMVVNHKRTERIYRQLGLALPRRRRRKKLRTGDSVPTAATYTHHVWTYDIMYDATAWGRKLKVLTVVDEYSRQALKVLPGHSLTSETVKSALADLFGIHGPPAVIRSDNGGEFIAAHLTEWLASLGTGTYHIDPGKPWQNAFGESFNSRVRDECLNCHEFYGLEQARVLLEQWRCEYNDEHPHSSLGYTTPAEFALTGAKRTAAVALAGAVN